MYRMGTDIYNLRKVHDGIRFEWDEANILKLKDAGRGVTPDLCREIAAI